MDYRVDAKFNFFFVVTTAGNPFLSKDRKERRLLFQRSRRRHFFGLWYGIPYDEHIKYSKYSNSLLSSLVCAFFSLHFLFFPCLLLLLLFFLC